MLKYVYFLLFSLFSFSVYAQDNPPEESTEINLQGEVPRIEFESTKFNYGDIYRGSIVTHSFPFENTGNGTLVLNSLHAACGCLNTKVFSKDGKTIQTMFKPHESGLIRVDFDSSQFSGMVTRTVTAETNMGSSSPTVTLTLSANILEEMTARPSLLYVGSIDKNIEKTFYVGLSVYSRAKPKSVANVVDVSQFLTDQIAKSKLASSYSEKILDSKNSIRPYFVESSAPGIEAKLLTTKTPNLYQIEVKVHDGLPIGAFHEKLTVWNNSTYNKSFQIPVVGEVVGRVLASAKYVEFGVVGPTKSAERVITFSSSAKNFEITAVKINLRRLADTKNLRDSEIFTLKKVKVSSRASLDPDANVAYVLHFKLVYPKNSASLTPELETSGVNISGNFLVKTNDPDYKEISVPFFGILRKEQ